jgi:hypothetical protein
VRILFHSSLADVLGHMGSFGSCDSFPRRLVIARLVPRGAMTPGKRAVRDRLGSLAGRAVLFVYWLATGE